MLVCGHGDVRDYCSEREMLIVDSYDGDIVDYHGFCKVLVTDQEMIEAEYYYLKGRMLARGYELVSTRFSDTEMSAEFSTYYANLENESRRKFAGRCKFGFQRVNGEIVKHEARFEIAKRIIELKDKGYTLREIQDDENVHHTDGRDLSISTIQLIIKNRKVYEE